MRAMVVLGWAAMVLLATAMLGAVAARVGPFPEACHLAGHLVICGVCAAATAWSAPGTERLRAAVGFGASVALGIAIEFVQAGWQPRWEAVHDVAVDASGAALGVIAWGARPAPRARHVGQLLSWLFHPLWLTPAGLFGLAFAATRDARDAAWFAATAMAALIPAIIRWLVGWRRGEFSHPDIPLRRQRLGLFAIGLVCVLAWTLLCASDRPILGHLSRWGLVATLGGAAVTTMGFKLSGHVAIPLSIGLAMAPFSHRGPLLLVGPAVALSWARVVAGRHRCVEVGAAWLFSLTLAALASLRAS